MGFLTLSNLSKDWSSSTAVAEIESNYWLSNGCTVEEATLFNS